MRIDQGGGDNAVSPVIAAGYTDQVTAAWADFRGHTDYRDVYSRTSADAGSTWAGTDQRLDTGLDTDSLAVDVAMNASGVVVVVFETSAGGSDRSRSVYAVRSTDGGANFGAPVVVDHNTGSGDRISSDPHVGVDASGNAHVVWRDNRGGDGDIYYNCWSSGSWLGSDIRVDAGSGYSDNPRIAVSASGNVYIVWEDDRNGAVDVYAASTTGCSGSWSPSEVRLDTDVYANDSLHPTVASNGSSAWVVWEDYRDGLPDIRMSMTNSGGASWSALDFRINANDAGVSGSRMPDVDAVSGWVFVVWEDDRNDDVDGYMDGDRDIYLNYSLDAGLNFQPMDFLVNDDPTLEYDAQEPRAAAVTDRLHITWLDFRNSPYYNADVYYRVLLLP